VLVPSARRLLAQFFTLRVTIGPNPAATRAERRRVQAHCRAGPGARVGGRSVCSDLLAIHRVSSARCSMGGCRSCPNLDRVLPEPRWTREPQGHPRHTLDDAECASTPDIAGCGDFALPPVLAGAAVPAPPGLAGVRRLMGRGAQKKRDPGVGCRAQQNSPGRLSAKKPHLCWFRTRTSL
jgi:hypothetical protein